MESRADLIKVLQQGVIELQLALDGQQLDALLDYAELILKWGRAYNLTAVRDLSSVVHRHLLDSLSIAKKLLGDRWIDVGTGAGLPGVPLALLFPEKEIHLLDSNGKKTRFLTQVRAELGLSNVKILRTRAETFQPTLGYDAVLSRAYADLTKMLDSCKHLCLPGGYFCAMKGRLEDAELEELDNHYPGIEVDMYKLKVPGVEETRHLVVIAKASLAESSAS